MGKASRTLRANVEANYAKNNNKYSEYADHEGRAKLPGKSPQRLHFEKVYDTSLYIQEQLTQYCKKCGVPMCEYLSLVELENYVSWMQQQ